MTVILDLYFDLYFIHLLKRYYHICVGQVPVLNTGTYLFKAERNLLTFIYVYCIQRRPAAAGRCGDVWLRELEGHSPPCGEQERAAGEGALHQAVHQRGHWHPHLEGRSQVSWTKVILYEGIDILSSFLLFCRIRPIFR